MQKYKDNKLTLICLWSDIFVLECLFTEISVKY